MSSFRRPKADGCDLKKSDGRPSEGNAGSSHYVIHSGIRAKAEVIPGEDPDELEALVRGYHQQWQPADLTERLLVDTLVRNDWRLRRFRRLEAIWAGRFRQAEDSMRSLDREVRLGEIFLRKTEMFGRIQDFSERSSARIVKQLKRLQGGRRAGKTQPETQAKPATAASTKTQSDPLESAPVPKYLM